jgi:hypothetical protein
MPAHVGIHQFDLRLLNAQKILLQVMRFHFLCIPFFAFPKELKVENSLDSML